MKWSTVARDLRGPFWRQFSLPPEIKTAHRLSDALGEIGKRWPVQQETKNIDSSPVFILSAGWGAGSTLTQRLIMSSEEILVWGEPLDEAAVIQRMGLMVSCVRSGWPPAHHDINGRKLSALSKQWVANLAPSVSFLRSAHRSMLEKWLKIPAENAGVKRWGLKEVRLTIDHARYLKWLFPSAKFIFVYRDLYDCYASCKGVNWYSVWPGYRASYPVAFARHWKLLAEGFIDGYEDVGGMLVRYEDLVTGKFNIAEMARYLEVDALDASVFTRKIGARGTGHNRLSLVEKAVLKSTGGRLRQRLGYCL